MKHFQTTIALAAALTLSACTSTKVKPSATTGEEARLIAVLTSGVAQKEKADACRELARVGTQSAVPVLVGLLGDEQFNHMARYALETIPGSGVETALRDALPTLKGRQLAGVITSLGVRRDAKAVKLIGDFLQDADPDVAHAAARALGAIATKPAAQALEGALALAPAGNRLAICEGLFRCAEAFRAKGQNGDAIRIYDRLRALPDAAHQVRAGALRGALLTRGNDGLPLLAEALRGTDYVLTAAAARTAMELPGAAVTQVLTRELTGLPVDRQILVLQTLGKRRDASALPAVTALARAGEQRVRLTAVRAIAEISDVAGAHSFVELAADSDQEIVQAAREGLASLPGKAVDDTVLALLASPDTKQKLIGIDQVARRRMAGAVPALEKTADSADPQLRAAALKQLGEFGGEPELTTLLNRLTRASSPDDLSALEEALSTLCGRIGKPELCGDQLIARLPQASAPQKAALLRVLGNVGGEKGLRAVRAGVDDANKEIHTAALEALRGWPTADAAPELLALARTGGSAEERTECLRSYLRWAADGDVPVKQRLTMCRQAAGLVERDAEKKLLLAALGGLNSPEAVTQIVTFLNQDGTREEACVAVVNIAERMSRGRNATKLPPVVIAGLEQVAKATANADLAKRAKTLLDANK